MRVGGVIDTVVPRDRLVLGRVLAVDAAEIDAVFIGVRAALVVGVDPAGLAEIVLCRAGAPAVEREVVGAFGDGQARERNADIGGGAAAAEGTGCSFFPCTSFKRLFRELVTLFLSLRLSE